MLNYVDQQRIRAQFYWEHTLKPIVEICKESACDANTIRGWAHQLHWKVINPDYSRNRKGKVFKNIDLDMEKQSSVEMDSRRKQRLNEALNNWNRANAAVLKSLAEGQ